jgi:farnesyl diphosphate synthase
MIFRLLAKYFHGQPYYVDLLDLFHDTTYRTGLGDYKKIIKTNPQEKLTFIRTSTGLNSNRKIGIFHFGAL